MAAFIILALFLAVQSLWSVLGGLRFLSYLRRSQRQALGAYHPPAAIIIPCKGSGKDLEQNAARFLEQDYPDFQAIFVVASEGDPAHAYLAQLITQAQPCSEEGRECALVVAGHSLTNGEKVNNLLAGVKAAGARAQILAFADIDGQPRKNWLRTLVGALENPEVTVSTGFRWYLPGAGFASRLRAAWDSSIATLLGETARNFAWGGSMAIRSEDFKRLRIAEHYWQGTVSDDYAVTRAVRESGGTIRFEPRCLMAAQGGISLGELVTWTNRQIIITRVYHPRYWWLGMTSYSLYALTFLCGIALIVFPSAIFPRLGVLAALMVITGLGMAKGALRREVARDAFPEEIPTLRRYGGCYWQLAPLVPWLMLFNFMAAGFVRRIEWSGTVYKLNSAEELQVLYRDGIEIL